MRLCTNNKKIPNPVIANAYELYIHGEIIKPYIFHKYPPATKQADKVVFMFLVPTFIIQY